MTSLARKYEINEVESKRRIDILGSIILDVSIYIGQSS